jgi:hypothetical protein
MRRFGASYPYAVLDYLDVAGPVRAEVFVVSNTRNGPVLSGPDGPGPWLLEVHDTEHPMESVRRIVESTVPGTRLVHSTSWRWEEGMVVLSFLAVSDRPVGEAAVVSRVDLARGSAKGAPTQIASDQVLEHALRHLAWLAEDDETVRAKLDGDWRDLLDRYVPEPFRQLGGG